MENLKCLPQVDLPSLQDPQQDLQALRNPYPKLQQPGQEPLPLDMKPSTLVLPTATLLMHMVLYTGLQGLWKSARLLRQASPLRISFQVVLHIQGFKNSNHRLQLGRASKGSTPRPR